MNLFQGDTTTIEALVNHQQGKRLLRLRFRQNDGPAPAAIVVNTLDASGRAQSAPMVQQGKEE
jgi:hypothetical protein